MTTPDTDHRIRALDSFEAPYIRQLRQIGETIGYGRSCQVLGDAWNEKMPGRGSMERQPDIEAAEMRQLQALKVDHERLLRAAFHALKSYECGNASTELARGVCAAIADLGLEGVPRG
ncbi:hypothetical protein [Azohydromonas aeria]|uniref:hypothetical protein n=1 Tax=Azohydromonas aeria TaxID=2590212 RepID=UPI0012F92D71|nr:hypothetical protein [Azohydromonas aeria]